MFRAAPIALVLLANGCGFNRAGVGSDGGADLATDLSGSANDLAGVDLAGADLAGRAPDLFGVDGGCALPHLLVAVETFAPGPQIGRVLRIPIAATGAQPACSELTGRGTLPPQPRAVTAAPGGLVAVATTDGLVVLDEAHDAPLWTVAAPLLAGTSYTGMPIDVFPLLSPPAVKWIAVAYANPNDLSQQIAFVSAYQDATTQQTWKTDGTQLPLNYDVIGMAQHRGTPSHIVALIVGSSPSAAMDVDPFATPSTKREVLSWHGTGTLASIATLEVGGAELVVWANQVSGGGAGADYIDDLQAPSGPNGPALCQQLKCKVLHAVPDPTQTRGIIALCEADATSAQGRKIVRFDSFSSFCETILDGTTMPNTRLARLAIAQ